MKILFTILIMLMAVNAGANTYYVDSASGNDVNAGTSTGAAWEHIQMACSTLIAGDTVFIRTGTYAEQSPDSVNFGGVWVNSGFRFLNSGTAGNEIVAKNYPGEFPMIVGSGAIPYRSPANLSGKSYIVFDSLEFRFGRRGIYMQTASFITIRYCKIDSTLGPCNNNNGGIITFQNSLGSIKHVTIEYNEIFANGQLAGGAPCEEFDDYISAFNTSGIHLYNFDSSIIRYNTIHHQEAGIHVKGPAPGSVFDTTWNIEIYGNTIYTTEDAGIWVVGQGHIEDISVHHNTLYDIGNSSGSGIMLGSGDAGAVGLNVRVYNNTIDSRGINSQYPIVDACSLFNNIAYEHGNTGSFGAAVGFKNEGGGTPSNFYSDYNMSYRTAADNHFGKWNSGTSYTLATWRSTFSYGTNSVIGLPGFTDAGNNDYTIDTTSLAATGGRGGDYDTYFGANDPGFGGEATGTTISGNVIISGSVVIE